MIVFCQLNDSMKRISGILSKKSYACLILFIVVELCKWHSLMFYYPSEVRRIFRVYSCCNTSILSRYETINVNIVG